MKKMPRRNFGLESLLKKISQGLRGKRVKMKDAFSQIYHHNKWGSRISVSGPGSTLSQTGTIRKKIPILIKELKVKSLMDAGCGDFHWVQKMKLDLDRYI